MGRLSLFVRRVRLVVAWLAAAAALPAAARASLYTAWTPATPRVKLGIDVLEDSRFLILRGKRVGLLTHPAGLNARGVSTVEVLRHAPGVTLAALFATEHGIWGTVPGGQHFPDQTDPRTGLKVYSLYTGQNTQHIPSAAQLRGIDALVIDLQDVGVRSYTFSGTMKRVLEGCFENHVEVVVLDRPNPLGGVKVSGPPLDPNLVGVSLVCEFPVPYVHGLTIGELARFAKGTPGVLQIKPADAARGRLTVVPMAGWHRSMRWTDTGLTWAQTSPEIGDFAAVMGYAMTGLGCELNHFAHGVGHQYWFRGISHPNIRAEVLARDLVAMHLPGLAYRVISAPNGRTGQPGTGLYIEVIDWDRWKPCDLSFELMRLACRVEPHNPYANPSRAESSLFLHELGSAALFHDLAANGAAVNIEAYLRQWEVADARYRESTRRFWLYP